MTVQIRVVRLDAIQSYLKQLPSTEETHITAISVGNTLRIVSL